jgi:2-methylcitrate dehydratase PrpD
MNRKGRDAMPAGGATRELVRFVGRTRFDHLPPDVVHDTKRVILDTIGCAIGGHATEAGKIVVKVKAALGGVERAAILGTSLRTSATAAAFVNAELANLLDADETFLMMGHHANCMVAVALAVGQEVGASGKDVLSAVAVGYDVAARVALSLDVRQEPGSGVEFGPLCGNGWITFGCASVAGTLLGLDEEQLMHAFGIAAASAPIPYLGRWERAVPRNRAMTKYAFYGPIAENGVLAALFAREGFVGDPDILDGDVGFWRLTGARGIHQGFLTERLGEKWWIADAAFKAYPGCRHVSTAMDLLAGIVTTHELTVDDIDSVTVRVNPVLVERHFGVFPHNEVDMLFSASYLLAVGVLERFVPGPEWVDSRHLADGRLRRLASRIELVPHPPATAAIKAQLARDRLYTKVPTELEVRARGRTFTAAAEYAKGDPWSPESRMSDAELADKFHRFSSGTLGPRTADVAVERIMSLERLEGIDDLIRELTV